MMRGNAEGFTKLEPISLTLAKLPPFREIKKSKAVESLTFAARRSTA
jgi:hypothetical protein